MTSTAPTAPAYRILLCDDEDPYRALLQVAFEQWAEERGCPRGSLTFDEATDGKDCLDRLADSDVDVDVILLDLHMPVLDGYGALPRLREMAPDTPVVVLSTASPLEAEERVLELGAKAFIQKPYDIFSLADQLCEKLGDAA